MLRLSLPARLVPPLATIKLALGLAAFFATSAKCAGNNPAFPYVYHGLLPIAFGATGALLLLGGREDRRALALGGFFLAAAPAWANAPLGYVTASGLGRVLLDLVIALKLSAFLPYFLWVFVREFPSPSPSLTTRRRFQLLARVSAVAGLLLFAFNLLGFLLKGIPRAGKLLAVFAPDHKSMVFYEVVISLTAGAFLLLPWKARQVQGPEHRRARVFMEILVLTFGLIILELLLVLFMPGYHDFFAARPRLQWILVTIVLMPALTLPFTIPYAVLVHRVLDVRLIARRALQYFLARSMVTALVAVPSAVLGLYVWINRNSQLTQLFSGSRALLLISAILVGAAALRYRKPLLDAIDRRFFREQFDARYILTLLVERIRSIRDSTSLADLVTREIDLALHLDGVSLFALDARSGLLVDPRHRTRRLDASSELALTLSNASVPLEVDLESPHSPFLKLPPKERQCLADGGFRLLVPILARDGVLLGMIGLGEKKSGLPFLKEDRQLLHAIASNAAWVLELEVERVLPSQPEDPTPRELPASSASELAKECLKCGALHPAYTVFCGTCSKKLEPSVVPYMLPGKFRFERRIGTGGMGVVYSGFDLALGRHAAIKTLRQVSREDILRLRREARTAAAVSHPHLAPIFGMETWQGMPLLIMELLEGGTLAQRITRERLAPREIVELGIAMAGALAQLHTAGILHRDVKPSNIGYTRDGVPKLMDFGIARVRLELAEEEEEEEETQDLDLGGDDAFPPRWSAIGENFPGRFRFAGTLAYLSPEAVRGEPADTSFDLWGLAIVLYECLLGRKVFAGNQQQVVSRIRSGVVPDFSQVCPEHDGTLGEFFREALHRSLARRPQTAEAMRRRLEEVRAELGKAPS
ncbi:MAG TPA: protein kinase [Thermoanaerobaculia bacterium]|nr:protein kinase [Thermoanaerobaculia bacterium]